MTDTLRLEAALDAQEGFKAFPYRDTRGLWTLGKGRCLETNPLSGTEWKKLLDSGWISISVSVNGANWLRDQAWLAAESHLASVYPWWDLLNDARQNALLEMAYQLGAAKFDAFHDMLAAIHIADWQEAFNQAMDSDWARQTPARARDVATQLLTGQFP